jgi:hypothetical protein
MILGTENQNSNGDLITPKSAIKRIAKQSGCRISDLITLSVQHDPFNCGSKGDIALAEWFANLWNRFGMQPNSHIRKLHYKIVSQEEDVPKLDGSPYRNTEDDSDELEKASKKARYLGLIDPRHLKDRRNPEPHLFAPEFTEPDRPNWSIADFDGFTIPSINPSFYYDLELPGIYVSGYDYDEGEQKYLLELWVEKSTMNDELIPVCKDYGINLITSLGFQSITSSVAVLSRAGAAVATGRPVRIFYVSDFDPAGLHMPVAVSRQIQFWKEQFGSDADIKLTPLVLTRQQVLEHKLPRKPIKDSDCRKGNFEDRHGEGAVELDALEAIYPGELDRIIRDEVMQYRDEELPDRLSMAESEAEQEVESIWEQATESIQSRSDDLSGRIHEVVNQFEPKIRELSEEFDAEMEELQEEADELESEVQHLIAFTEQETIIPLPTRPVSEVIQPDESRWLYDSGREYMEQLYFYNLHKEGKL